MTRWVDRPLGLTIVFAILLTASLGAIHAAIGATGCTSLVVASSLEKATLLQQAASRFNSESAGGSGCVHVEVEPVASGDAETGLRGGWPQDLGARPDVWSPAASAWLFLSQQHRAAQGLPPVANAVNPSLFQSPLVVAMPEPMARALGWPGRPIGWSDIYQLATNPLGWASFGHPEWGAFRLGKTNPDVSTSGLHALIGTYFAATGRTSDLTEQDLQDPRVTSFIKAVESSVVHYGDTAFTFLTNLRAADQRGKSLSYVSAVAIEEKEIWNYNRGNVTGDPALGSTALPPHVLLAAIYPKEGTLFADHPYAVLDEPWVTPDKRNAADRFLAFLLSSSSQSQFQAQGFRDRFGTATPEISAADDLDPSKPDTILRLPSPPIIAAIQSSWTSLRKRARVLVILDLAAAGSSQELAPIKTSLAEALSQMGDDDQVGLWTTPGRNSSFDNLVPIGSLATTRPKLKMQIDSLAPIGRPASSLDSVIKGLNELDGAGFDPSRIQAVALVSNGKASSSAEFDGLLRQLEAQPPDRTIPVFTMAYGNEPDITSMTRIAIASGGSAYRADSPGAFRSLFLAMLSNF